MKLILTWAHEVNPDIPKIPTTLSLAVIIGILVVTTVASLIKAKRDPSAVAHSGALHATHHKEGGQAVEG